MERWYTRPHDVYTHLARARCDWVCVLRCGCLGFGCPPAPCILCSRAYMEYVAKWLYTIYTVSVIINKRTTDVSQFHPSVRKNKNTHTNSDRARVTMRYSWRIQSTQVMEIYLYIKTLHLLWLYKMGRKKDILHAVDAIDQHKWIKHKSIWGLSRSTFFLLGLRRRALISANIETLTANPLRGVPLHISI